MKFKIARRDLPLTLQRDTANSGRLGDEVKITCNVDEARTLMFALQEYRDKLTESYDKSRATSSTVAETYIRFEEEMFLHEQLHKVNSVLYDMLVNHTPDDAKYIQNTMDVV